jgi:hypothetical protein
MKKYPAYLMISVLFLLMVSCSGKANEKQEGSVVETDSNEEIAAPGAQRLPSTRVYGIESGYIKYKSKASGFDLITERWFDNYGALQYEEIYLIMGEEKNGSSTLIRDGSRYTWNFDSTEGQCHKNYHAPKNSYDELTQRQIDRYGIKRLGEEEVLGRMCQKLSSEKPAKTLQWIWKGIALKSVSEFGKQEVTIDVVELTEGKVDDSKFEMPDGVVFQDL